MGTLTPLKTPIIDASRMSSEPVKGCVKVRRILLFLCFTFTDPSDNDLLPLSLDSVLFSPRELFRSDGDRDFFREFLLLLVRFCRLDSLVVCMVGALMRSETM